MKVITQQNVRTVLHLEGDSNFVQRIMAKAAKDRADLKDRLVREKRAARNRKYWRKYKAENAEKIKQQKKAWRVANKDKVRAYESEYYRRSAALRAYRVQKNREYRARDRELRKAAV